MNSGFAFWMPFLVIFGAAIIISVAQRYARDLCLVKFDAHHVLIRMKDGQWIWGQLQVHSKALEVLYEEPIPTPAGHEHLSYILYEQNVADITLILRPEPRLGTPQHELWMQAMSRLRHPPLIRRLKRRFRNFFHMLRNAFSESIAAAVGIMKQRTAMGRIAGADAKATEVGQKLLTAIPSSYEPILEVYLSKEVAVDSFKDAANPAAGNVERVGVLQEYSDKFLLIRDVILNEPIPLDGLRDNDAPDRFAVILPRTTSFVRHLVRRSAAPVAAPQSPHLVGA